RVPSAFKRYCTWLIAGYDMGIGPHSSRSVGGLITCTCPQRCPELLPRSRYQRPPGQGSIFIGNGLPPGICPSAPSSSRTASKVSSIGAAISISLRISKASTDWRSLVSVVMMLLSWDWEALISGLLSRSSLGAFLNSVELMAPELFEGFHPVMHGFQLPGFEVVQALLALLRHRDDADLAQHAEVLGDSRLRQPERHDYRPDSQRSAPRQQIDDLPPPWLGNGVEYVGCCCCSRHRSNYIPIWEYIKPESAFCIELTLSANRCCSSCITPCEEGGALRPSRPPPASESAARLRPLRPDPYT